MYNKFDELWKFVWENFFYEKTNLIYDFRIHTGKNGCIDDLPTPYEIRKSFPNPSGLGTGMEDSVLNGGSLLEAVIARYNVTGEAHLRNKFEALVKGLLLCASVSNESGYVARSVSPVDCKSYYINSSRDQYTHWIYGLYKAYFSKLCSNNLKVCIKKKIVEVVTKFERDVIPENHYSIVRADGTIAETTQMWGEEILPHEALRLPMFYLAAYAITNESKWYALYKRYIYNGIKISNRIQAGACATYAYLQMQYSLRLIYEVEKDEKIKNDIQQLMYKTVDCIKEVAPRYAKNLLSEEYQRQLSTQYTPWRKRRFVYMFGEEKNGYYWFNPVDDECNKNAFYPVREIGECLIVMALCPDKDPDHIQISALQQIAKVLDCKNHYTSAPLLIVDAYWSLRDSGIKL
ncbi:hypothetical protein [Ructibacterium gallinarum]|uniref:Uncharacterized protein n=1 Tax=Ructibacterium gallinarum TaxID=2779355 RepID=A0A9D5M3L9_9FIRM|nr:hypothetical protein [Ructibacterium gallinarum]MBE5040913.1 hypothetical protein [Ructibacterium gallinarum]